MREAVRHGGAQRPRAAGTASYQAATWARRAFQSSMTSSSMRRIAACTSSSRELKPMSVKVFLSLLPWKRSSRARCTSTVAVRRDEAAVAVAAEVLGGEEAEDGHVAEAAGAAALVGGAPGLAGVLDHGQAVLRRRPP